MEAKRIGMVHAGKSSHGVARRAESLCYHLQCNASFVVPVYPYDSIDEYYIRIPDRFVRRSNILRLSTYTHTHTE